ncbi:serine/threonine-protein kinase [Metamycoplasma canadense]|nr:serine/threonine-protein kinase [Metamycoplasma canadense]
MIKILEKYKNLNKHFEDFKLIGSGGYGQVYSATFKKDKRRYAIKILTTPDVTKKSVNLIRFKNECSVLAKIRSKNVVRIHGFYTSEDESYYSMELIEGIDLKTLIAKSKKINVEEAIRIAKEICQGLIDIHSSNVVHRDLKPSNILIEQNTNDVKLIDFGISIADETLKVTADNKTVGSIQYLAPEILKKKEKASFRSDIYAFGMILYEMLSGHPAFQGSDNHSILLMQINVEIPPLEGVGKIIPQAVENIIIRCTAKDPSERYNNCKDILNDLENCLRIEAMNDKKLILESKKEPKKNKKTLSLKWTIILISFAVAIIVVVLIVLIINKLI